MILIALLLIFLVFGFFGAPFLLWGIWALAFEFTIHAPQILYHLTLIITVIGSIKPLRRALVTRWIVALVKKLDILPSISPTEKTAIEAGSAWVEKEFFSGKPDLKTLLQQPEPKLTDDERAFLANQLETLCAMIDDWEIWKSRDVPDRVWDYIKKEKFLGMIIPKEYGGLGFSPYAHSEVIKKVASRSFVVAIYIMVPNSLGPAELLIHYGTKEQKDHLLPRLANGQEIPCFALTESEAGSDAGNVQAGGELFKKNGELYIRLNFDKRYISLSYISTLMGLAFRLKDPENLLGKGIDLGLTCALIPSHSEGIILHTRHDPLGVPFYNCPIHGRNVEVPASMIVGGIEQAGNGWRMLMECLSAGRGISFPAQMAGGSDLSSYIVSAYALVRHQFGVPIGRFEGVQKSLARMVGNTYLLESLRLYTLSALNQGLKPAVIASISKYYATETGRKIVNDAMDIIGGAGISLGPRNKIAHYYIAAPMSITVEGANILTRSLMIFGQGAFRAHPYAFKEIDALEKGDVNAFDQAFWAHIGMVVRNTFRAKLLNLTRGWLDHPFNFSKEAKYYRKISWASATFALMSDIAMGTMGGSLKFKESITSRFADIVSYLYISSAILHHYEKNGRKRSDWVAAEYALDTAFYEIQNAFEEIYRNFRTPFTSWVWNYVVYAACRFNPMARQVSDRVTHSLADEVLVNPAVVDRLAKGIYIPKDPNDFIVEVRAAANLYRKVEPLEKKIRKALKLMGKKGADIPTVLPELIKQQVVTEEQAKLILEWEVVRKAVVQVDEFNEEQYHAKAPGTSDQL